MENRRVDVCIIGAGSGGLTIAAVAAQLGISVVLIEADKMGGDCLNYGCIPSKSLLHAAKVAEQFRNADRFGLIAQVPDINLKKVLAQVQNVINTIAPHDSVERFEKLGVTVIQATAKFLNKTQVQAGNWIISAKRFVIAAGSTPAIPVIKGLDQTPYLTNETIFSLPETPQHLIIIGGGAIGCEMAQAFMLLGVKVTVLEAATILPRDDIDLVAMLRQQLLTRGLILYENCKILAVETINHQINVVCEHEIISGSHLLVATGRSANVAHLNLAAAAVAYTERGIKTDARLRTSNKRIYAVGDITGDFQFTHIASYHASIVIRNLLFCIPAKVNYRTLPWVTYTVPELAQVGLTANAALRQHAKIRVTSADFIDNDRAQTAHETVGRIKVITNHKGNILGVSILGAHAGELLAPWILAMKNKLKVRAIADMIIPYPTLSEIHKLVVSNFYKESLFSPKVKRVVKFLMKLRT